MQAYKLVGTEQYSLRDLADGGSSITFHTLLLPDDLYLNCRRCNGKAGEIMFVPEGSKEYITNEDAYPKPPEPDEPKQKLSPSQTVRLKIHKLWEVEGKIGDKEEHYEGVMKRIGTWIDKLIVEAEAKNGL